MKKITLPAILSIICVISVAGQSKLYTNVHTVKDDVHSYSIKTVSDQYFEVSLFSMAGGQSYIAEKDLEAFVMKDGKGSLKHFYIVDAGAKKEDKAKKFKNSAEFLNFMDAHGYEMLDQKKRNFIQTTRLGRKNNI
jgi:hypothetical protein